MSNQPPPKAADFSREFPILGEMVFFNHAGVAPISGRAAAAMRAFADQAERRAYVKSGWYKRVNEVKESAARLINAQGGDEIAFVANTSSGIGLVARGLPWRRGDQVVISNVEYPANRYPWEDLKRFGVELIEVRELPDGRIDVEDVLDAITDRTRVVALSHVQYASGFRIDLKPIAETVHRAGGYLCVDAIQSLGALPVDVRAMGIDFLSADGHKWLLSPEGCGVFYCKRDLIPMLHPAIVGWMNMVNASEYGKYQFQFLDDGRRFEPGSYNVPGILGLGATLELFHEVGIDAVWARIEALTTRMCVGLAAKGYRVFSPRERASERSGIVVFTPPPVEARRTPPMHQIVADLEAKGIVIVVREGRLRASPHFYNTVEQVDAMVAALP
ncbi:MAG: aminotransferase class V-fold PLP-dependent enzyme [Planctomycetes bacterium]|nr:aminotransferase class V-fold PLP-dependent enzyme [Planctomycetota bacterium]